MIKLKRITSWERYNEKEKTWKHNHINENGWDQSIEFEGGFRKENGFLITLGERMPTVVTKVSGLKYLL